MVKKVAMATDGDKHAEVKALHGRRPQNVRGGVAMATDGDKHAEVKALHARRPQNVRGGVKKQIVKDLFVMPGKKVIKWSAKTMSPRLRRAPPLITLKVAGKEGRERGMVNEPRREPVQETNDLVLVTHASVTEPPSTSSVDMFLEAVPFPTKKDAMATQWRKVDMMNAIEHEGSVLFEEKGKWTVLELCHVYPDTVVVPLIMPSLRTATPP